MLTGSTRDRLVCNMKQGWKYAAAIGLMAVSFGAAHAQDADEALIKKGEYISRLSDCVACHTALHGQAFAGGLEIKSPIGTIYSTNITPDPTYGIGKYTLQDFTKAVRQESARMAARSIRLCHTLSSHACPTRTSARFTPISCTA